VPLLLDFLSSITLFQMSKPIRMPAPIDVDSSLNGNEEQPKKTKILSAEADVEILRSNESLKPPPPVLAVMILCQAYTELEFQV
jgi:hypothetical protein